MIYFMFPRMNKSALDFAYNLKFGLHLVRSQSAHPAFIVGLIAATCGKA